MFKNLNKYVQNLIQLYFSQSSNISYCVRLKMYIVEIRFLILLLLTRLDYYVPYHSGIGGSLTEDRGSLGGIGNETLALIKRHTHTAAIPRASCVHIFNFREITSLI